MLKTFGRCLVFVALTLGMLALGSCAWFQQQPSVDFSLSPAEGNKPLLVDFTPSADGEPIAYAWDFGDGGASSEEAPAHVYYTAGVYSVTLTVTYETGSLVSRTRTDCVEVRKGLTSAAEPDLYWLDTGGARFGAAPWGAAR